MISKFVKGPFEGEGASPWGKRRGTDVLEFLRIQAGHFGIKINKYATSIIRRTLVVLMTRWEYPKCWFPNLRYKFFKSLGNHVSATISSTTGHALETERMCTSYIMLDYDIKLSINLRFMLHCNKRLHVARDRVIVIYISIYYVDLDPWQDGRSISWVQHVPIYLIFCDIIVLI